MSTNADILLAIPPQTQSLLPTNTLPLHATLSIFLSISSLSTTTDMGSKSCASVSLFIAFNLLFLSMVVTATTKCPPPPKPCNCKPTPTTPKSPPKPSTPKSPPKPSTPKAPPTVTPPSTPPSSKGSCPIDILKLGVCGNVLSGLVGVVVGTPANKECCTLLQGVTDLDAAICLCTAIKANVLGLNLNIPVSLSLLLNTCGNTLPSDFQCK